MNRYDIDSDTSYCLGMSLSIEAIKHQPSHVREVILSEKAIKNSQLEYLKSLCDANSIPMRTDDRLIGRLSLKENCYCIAFFEKYHEKPSSDEHVLLYHFTDLGQLGTTLRSAVSFDFKDIILIDSDIDYFDPACVRASMGAVFHCRIERFKDIDDYKKAYPDHHLYPFVSHSDKELGSLKIEKPFSLLISQDDHELDDMDGYYLEHNCYDEISLSIRSSIILERVFEIKP